MKQRPRAGFTLVELLVFSAIFTVIIGSFITVLVAVVTVQVTQSTSNDVSQQGQFLTQQLQYYIESARLADIPQDVATSTLVLRESVTSSSYDPTVFSMSTGTVYLRQGVAGALQPLTSNRVTVSALSFTRHYNLSSSSAAFGTDSVSFSFIVSEYGGNHQYTRQFQATAGVFAPVPKIALVQQMKVENNLPSAASIVAAFPSANESGDLLLAVVTHRGTGTSSITDTNGNIWTLVASGTIASPSGVVALYTASNATSGANTATAAFAGTATYTSMFLYEYRGAATSSSLDAHGAQSQNSSTPVSPSVSPGANAELLFGVDDNAVPTTAIFSAGTGYTLETSSTVGYFTQVFTEDSDQYVTGAVSAGWKSSVTTTSTALIATFR